MGFLGEDSEVFDVVGRGFSGHPADPFEPFVERRPDDEVYDVPAFGELARDERFLPVRVDVLARHRHVVHASAVPFTRRPSKHEVGTIASVDGHDVDMRRDGEGQARPARRQAALGLFAVTEQEETLQCLQKVLCVRAHRVPMARRVLN